MSGSPCCQPSTAMRGIMHWCTSSFATLHAAARTLVGIVRGRARVCTEVHKPECYQTWPTATTFAHGLQTVGPDCAISRLESVREVKFSAVFQQFSRLLAQTLRLSG